MSDPVVDPVLPVTAEAAAEPAPAPLPEVIHLRTQVTSVFAILDQENNAVNPTPLTIELDKLNAATLTALLARVKEEKQKFAEQARAAGLA